MKISLFSATGLVMTVLAAPLSAQNGRGCNSDWPQVGSLHLNSAGPITVYRFANRMAVPANNGAPICIEDMIPPRPQSGRVELLSGEPPLTLLANQALQVPGRRRSILGWLRNLRLRAALFRAGSAGSLGSDQIGFPLTSLAIGSAEIASDHRRLIIPVNRVDIPLTVELWSPDARQPQLVTVEARAGEAIFASIRPQLGLWRVVVRAERRVVGGFRMVDRVSDAELGALAIDQRLSPRESSLALACLDFPRYGLEAYQRLAAHPADRAIVLTWQNPTAELSCGTPTALATSAR